MATKAELIKKAQELGATIPEGSTRADVERIIAAREAEIAEAKAKADESETVVPEGESDVAARKRPERGRYISVHVEGSTRCDNHPERDAIWESDGKSASQVRRCEQCVDRYGVVA